MRLTGEGKSQYCKQISGARRRATKSRAVEKGRKNLGFKRFFKNLETSKVQILGFLKFAKIFKKSIF